MVDVTGKSIMQQSLAETLVTTEVLLPQGESNAPAKVAQQAMDENGQIIGNFNENPWVCISRWHNKVTSCQYYC